MFLSQREALSFSYLHHPTGNFGLGLKGQFFVQKTVRGFEGEWSAEIIKPYSNLNMYIADEAYG